MNQTKTVFFGTYGRISQCAPGTLKHLQKQSCIVRKTDKTPKIRRVPPKNPKTQSNNFGAHHHRAQLDTRTIKP
jgi:hypothetical protein